MLARSAGILIPLFSLRTRATLGRGEIADLAPMIDFALSMGHRAIQLLPLDETAPGELSPYSAICVQAIDPMYIAIRDLGGVGRVVLGRARTNIGNGRRIPRAVVRREKLALLERAFRATRARGGRDEGPELDAFIKDNAEWIHDYALFRALKDRFEWAKWEAWPRELMRREATALEQTRRELADKIEMYCYWQFIAHRQWNEIRRYASSRGVALGGDLAFSPGRDSAEVWANQDDFDLTRSVGAPPDTFNARGQRWGLPLPNWAKMRAGGYRILRSRVRRASALFDLIRIDHVVGLYRTFNFGADENQPGIFTPADEAQQKTQGEEIINAIKHEAGAATIIAEDLGTVPPWVRQSLTELGVAGYKVMQWERVDWDSPAETYLSPVKYPELSLATTGTHDTEALTIWWREQPIGEREKLVRALGVEAQANPREMLNRRARDAILGALYQAPSRLVLTPFQDLFGWSVQINRPGQVGDSNWTYRLPLPIEKLRRSRAIQAQVALVREIAMRSGRFSA
ncbi:MAG: 4-alpha-glucanotransferase [Candidatus Binatus sp.]|uniref:4-alpha-glucanotransferase n=1 Tax=Candidatus Binatus sp. TaxID=2811406 RepID=UPI002725BF24|nr:4-alpha-glucanotransferase [Candidatus Binatus sp.]MDO8433588.1 4-alpha-glucanotransferase [Candidatus Binatus sp.]